jgi:1-phosphatidylinositol-3-phosphate 5-kinase
MVHLNVMLRQMLTIEQIPNIKEWGETLLGLALRIAREMTFTALPHRQGQDMDVRRYVKIKKIPGGLPRDSEYVNGAVITKNVAHKQMSRLQLNPRVMLVTFPLEFYRVEGQYMHFGQIVRQEKEYLGNLASRIAALRPHVVLVEKSVSRLALDALAKHNIAVARTVKPSAVQTIARMTQGDVFSSMDKLALEPRLGHCTRFRIQTYDHPLIPGRRKTYMRFEGCNRDMGCTIILRGGDIETLRRIKKVTRFLTFIVRNLKLETHLWKDSVISLPLFNADAIPSSTNIRRHLSVSLSSMLMPPPLFASHLKPLFNVPSESNDSSRLTAVDSEENFEVDLPDEDADQLRLTRRIDQSLEPYTKTFISVSATLRFPAPYPIRRMKDLDNELNAAKRAWEDEVIRKEERLQSEHAHEAAQQETSPLMAVQVKDDGDREDINAQIEALPSSNLPTTPLTGDTDVTDEKSYFTALSPNLIPANLSGFKGLLHGSSVAHEEPAPCKTSSDIYLESRYSLLKWQHEEHRRIWEWYLRKNRDDFVVEKYQCISLWEYIIPADEDGPHRACFPPRLNYIKFYGENDMTLGQFIEKSVNDTLVQFWDPKAFCDGKGCDQPLARHRKVYVHNETQLFVAVEQWDGQIKAKSAYYPAPDLITTWSACRVCGSATPFIPVSEEMQRYSFAKFLELHFYPADVKLVQGAGCQHNIYQHHIRYFAAKGMTVRFQTDPVVLHEIVYPPFRIRVRPETQLDLKNNDFDRLHQRNLMWYTGLVDDLKLISIDAATGDEKADARLLADINILITRAETEREDISRLINRIYRESLPTDTLALNQVHAYRQDKIVAWQQDFDRLPKPRAIDRNSKRASAFNSVRAIWPRRYDLAGAFDYPHLPSSSVSEAEEESTKTKRVVGDSFISSASEASESETNEPAVESVPSTSQSTPSTDLQDNTQESDPDSVDLPASINDPIPQCDAPMSDPDSDSTIGAVREEPLLPEAPEILVWILYVVY